MSLKPGQQRKVLVRGYCLFHCVGIIDKLQCSQIRYKTNYLINHFVFLLLVSTTQFFTKMRELVNIIYRLKYLMSVITLLIVGCATSNESLIVKVISKDVQQILANPGFEVHFAHRHKAILGLSLRAGIAG